MQLPLRVAPTFWKEHTMNRRFFSFLATGMLALLTLALKTLLELRHAGQLAANRRH